MTRRRLCLCLTLLLVALLLLPAVHWRVIGWVKGEAFYQGRPTSWWSQEADRLQLRGTGVFGSIFSPITLYDWARGPSRIQQYLGTFAGNSPIEFELLQRDQEALSVLVELLHDSSPQVRLIAVQALLHLGADAKPSMGDLLPLCEDDDDRVQKMPRSAMRQIEMEAAAPVEQE